jgi:GT2 family glycosyltransferase
MDALFSVVIPTRDRRSVLQQTLAALEQQRGAPPFEIVVVDDGSTDDTLAWLDTRPSTRPTQIVRLASGGPARARNAGIGAANGRWVAFLGDDTIPEPDWLAQHFRAHQERGEPAELAVIGYTCWHERLPRTRFLDFVNEYGLQFGYSIIENPEDVPFNFFYGSNLSVQRAFLGEEPFNPRFPAAAWEDIELGYRLKTRGLRLVYEPRAVAFHDHVTSIRSFLKRRRMVGRSAVVFRHLHPELEGFLGFSSAGPPTPPPRAMVRVLETVAFGFERWPIAMPRLWQWLSNAHYARGCREG